MARMAYSIDETRHFMRFVALAPAPVGVSHGSCCARGFGFRRAGSADMMALDGAWSGGGSVKFPSGAKEAARCRANFKKRGAESYRSARGARAPLAKSSSRPC